MGALVAFVVWVVMVALIYALVQYQAQHGALTGVVRVVGLRTILFAGQSALEEASYVLRNPPGSGAGALEAIEGGSGAGTALEPEVTREKYRDLIQRQVLSIGPVTYDVVSRPPASSDDPWLVDLCVRVTFQMSGTKITREVRRRFLGEGHVVRAISGPKTGQIVMAQMVLKGQPMFEVIGR